MAAVDYFLRLNTLPNTKSYSFTGEQQRLKNLSQYLSIKIPSKTPSHTQKLHVRTI